MTDSVTVMWTPIPGGLRQADETPILSVLVSPRLRAADGAPATLDAFGPFVDWPDTLRSLQLAVQFLDAPELPVTLAHPSAASSELWTALFPAAGTAVRPHEPDDFSQHEIVSYGSVRARDALRDFYADHAAQSAVRPPPAEGFLARLARQHEELYGALSQATRFHTLRPPAGSAPPPPDQLADLLDFHAVVSSLGDHLPLLRALGLLFDVLLPPEAPHSDVPTLLALRPHFRPSDICPQVQVELHADGFFALPREALILLPLREGGHDLVEVDVDGALLKIDALAATLASSFAAPAPDAPTTVPLPALRSGGLALTLNRRDTALAERLQMHAGLEQQVAQGATPQLTARELVRGYAIDVWDARSGWRSLCRRRGTYRFARAPHLAFNVEDVEGWIQLAVTAHTGQDGGPPVLRLHESLARWDGWSLVAPRPGKAMSHEPDPASPPERPTNDPLTSTGVGIDWAAEPRTLPALRYGHTYRMRARVVDLAGHVVALGEAPTDEALPSGAPLRYRRFEPVPAPVSMLRAPLDADANSGESSNRLVLRTDNQSPAQDGAPGVAGGDRQLVPPRTSVQLAEAHGALDDGSGRPRADLYGELRTRDAAQLGTDATGKVTLEPSERFVVPYLPDPLARGIALRDLPGTPPGTVGRPDAGGALTYEAISGAVVRPGSATLLPFDFDRQWPRAVGLRIAVTDGDAPPDWDPAARQLTVHVPKGSLVRVPLSCYVERDDLELMAIWGWLRDWLDTLQDSDPQRLLALSDDVAQATQLALEGGHWMLTPPRELVLVNAVRQPLGRPSLAELVADRAPSATETALRGTLHIHGRSTSRIELLAEWTEPVDRDDGTPPDLAVPFTASVDAMTLPEPPPPGEARALRTGDRPVGYWRAGEDRVEFNSHMHPRHELHDTRRRRVRYSARVASRFREYFPPADPGDFTRTSEPAEVDVPSSARPAAPRVLYAVPTFGWERREDTNVRVSRRLGGGLRVYLARPWFSSGEGERLGVVLWPGDLTNALRGSVGRHVSQWGRDPVVDGDAVGPEPRMFEFPRATELLSGVMLSELGSEALVDVAAHEVDFVPERDVWSCDIELSPGSAYRPFVRLALARVQSHAVPGAELSPVVLLDWTQLAPDRAAIVTHDPVIPGLAHVTITGTTYRGTAVSQTGGRVELVVQQRYDPLPEDLGWVDLLQFDFGQPELGSDTTLLWRGSFKVPTDPGRGPFRILIQEVEDWPTDDGIGHRTMYMDVLRLPD